RRKRRRLIRLSLKPVQPQTLNQRLPNGSIQRLNRQSDEVIMKHNWHDGNDLELLINGEEFFPAVFESIRTARHQVLLETFIIAQDQVGNELQQALISAAQRGVQVDVMADDYGTYELTSSFVAAMVD